MDPELHDGGSYNFDVRSILIWSRRDNIERCSLDQYWVTSSPKLSRVTIFAVTVIGWECGRLQHSLLKKVVYGVKNKRDRLLAGVFWSLDSKRFITRHCVSLDRTLRHVFYSFTKSEI
jgi:hypothetical protein